MKRKILSRSVLSAESAAITQFIFDRTMPDPQAKLPLKFFYQSYRVWRVSKKMSPTKLNIDGFGRLFPHVYERKSAYWGPAKHALKCVFGLSLGGTR